MMKYALIGAALVATAATGNPAGAQEVITEPGYCAQFYPNANCQNIGPGNPYTDSAHANLQPFAGEWHQAWRQAPPRRVRRVN
jgi:hypothetical protein